MPEWFSACPSEPGAHHQAHAAPPAARPRPRRPVRAAIAVVLATLLLAACGGGSAGEASGDAADAAATPAAEDAFPVTVSHQYGETTITEPPERVVALETVYLDALLALGVTPVGALNFDYDPSGVAPWAQDALDPEQTTLISVTDGVSPEQIAQLQPDLIFGSYAVAQDQAMYDTLSELAPTTGLLGDGVEGTWQEVTLAVGKALGRTEQAEEVVAEAEGAIDQVVSDLPGLEGKTQALAAVMGPGQLGVIANPEDNATKFLGELGLSVAPGIADLTTQESSVLSMEQLERLDGDLLLVGSFAPGGLEELEASPLFQQLPAVQSGAYAALDTATLTGIRTPTTLNVPDVLEQIRPALEAAANS